MEIVLNRRMTRSHLKKLEFREAEPEPGPSSPKIEPGFEAFLKDTQLSAGMTEWETAFLKGLTFNGKRPSPLYYYRELQNLRDPLHFLPLSSNKRRNSEKKVASETSRVRGKTSSRRHRRLT
jgi:hypothetical protein